MMHVAASISGHEYPNDASERGLMRRLPQEDREKIMHQVEQFRVEKAKLDREVAKWDDSGNDIIVLAKQMCMIMMEMTDFTRYVLENFFFFKLYLLSPVQFDYAKVFREYFNHRPGQADVHDYDGNDRLHQVGFIYFNHRPH